MEGKRNHKKDKTGQLDNIKIFNLSSFVLEDSHISLLQKGLHFAPCNRPNPFTLFKDLNRFLQNLIIKKFFNHLNKTISKETPLTPTPPSDLQDLDALNNLEELLWGDYMLDPEVSICPDFPITRTQFKPKSTFCPTHVNGPYIYTFYSFVNADMMKMCQDPNTPCRNLKKDGILALQSLENNHNLIKPAGKGGSIVILGRKDYMNEAYRLISDKETYTIERSLWPF